MPVSPRRGRTERRNETLEDKRFRQHLEKEFEEFTPGGSLKTRAAKRDLEQDRELVNQRLRDHQLKKTRSAMRKAKEAKEAEARKREDREHGRQYVRDTKMRIDLTKELIEKVTAACHHRTVHRGGALHKLTPTLHARCEKRS